MNNKTVFMEMIENIDIDIISPKVLVHNSTGLTGFYGSRNTNFFSDKNTLELYFNQFINESSKKLSQIESENRLTININEIIDLKKYNDVKLILNLRDYIKDNIINNLKQIKNNDQFYLFSRVTLQETQDLYKINISQVYLDFFLSNINIFTNKKEIDIYQEEINLLERNFFNYKNKSIEFSHSLIIE